MTGRSYDSLASERRLLRNRVTDDDLFDYSLRVAYLSFLLTPRPQPITTTQTVESRESRDLRDYQSRISNSFAAFGDIIREMAGRDGPKPVKYPERLLKVLDQRMQDIAMGKDRTYTDQVTRRVIAMFWSTFKEPSFYRQMEKSRKVEELILNFVSTARKALAREQQLAENDAWKIELNNQIAHFVRIIRDSLKQVSHVSPELTARVEMYASKLTPSAPSDNLISEPSTSRVEPPPPPPAAATIADMPLVKIIGRLFDKEDDELQREINSIKRFCTEKAALLDLKTCLKNINANLPFPGRREDFQDDSAWQHWKTIEQTHLSQMMVAMVQFHPELAKSTPADSALSSTRPESLYSSRASMSSRHSVLMSNGDIIPENSAVDDETVSAGHHFTFIPPNPRKYYKKLIERCVEYDLRAMHTLPEDQEVPLGILSTSHLDIINECALRWRVMPSYRVSCFLDVIKYKYEREEVPLECIPEALQHVQKEFDAVQWPIVDREYLSTVYSSIFNIFLAALYHAFDRLPDLPRKAVVPFVDILDTVQASGLLELYQVDIAARMRELSDRVRILAMHHYTDHRSELISRPGVNRALPFLLLSDILENLAKKLDKTFNQPILGHLDIVSLFVETQVPLFLTDLEESKRRLLESSMNQPTPDVPIEDIFALYRRTRTLLNLLTAFAPASQQHFDLLEFFEPYVKQWLINTDDKTGQWVQTAISVDNFERQGEEHHSSSVVDLFHSLDTPINFVLDLEWPDKIQEARFLTSLSKTLSTCMEKYCRRVEELFMEEMFPRPTDPYLQPQKQSAWLEKAKLSIQGEKKVEPFNFTASSCVKLNNIEAARGLLDKLYTRMGADEASAVLSEEAPPLPSKVPARNLFTVKIVMAEGLVASEGRVVDTFATLSDEHGNRVAKTRTIYESNDPRWEETFDISVDTALWLMVSVRDRSLVGKHDIVGRSYICLDPRSFGDFLAHDLSLNLEPEGKVRLRISMEGEKDDILFFFGRAFRSLKRTEGDMVRIFVDKMVPLFRYVLSRTAIKRLAKGQGGGALDYNKALGNISGLFGSLGASSSEVQIPLPQHEKPRIKTDGLLDEEVEAALVPLTDYLNDNLEVLNSTLSTTARETVMTRIWKELLTIIEGLLVPPLSDTTSTLKPLLDKELDIVFKWLKSLLFFFHADGEGLSMETLQNPKYREIISLRLYYDWDTDQLMEEAVRMMQSQLRSAPTVKKRAKTVYSQRNLGTIKDRKREKRHEKQADNMTEPIFKILRMRPNTADFLSHQLQVMNQIQAEQQSRKEQKGQAARDRFRPGGSSLSSLPPPPPPR